MQVEGERAFKPFFVNKKEVSVKNNAQGNSNSEAQPVHDEATGNEDYEVGGNTNVINEANDLSI